MELTQSQISELFSEQTRTAEGFSALVNVLLNNLMLQERALWLNEHDESGNGFRPRRWNYAGLELTLRVPRTRDGGFTPQLLAIIRSEDDEKARLFTSLYEKGLTTEQIGEISEQIYGRHYSKQQVSFLANKSRDAVMAWLSRPLQKRYLVVYIDATYSYTRRGDSVSKEAYYTMLGVCEDGTREVLGVVNYPQEGALSWQAELEALSHRGVKQIDLIVSDGLVGIENAISAAFPTATHQLCVTHLKRNIIASVASKDKKLIKAELEDIFPKGEKGYNSVTQFEEFCNFALHWGKKYPSMKRLVAPRNIAYFTYLSFPEVFHRMIYTTNWIERLNGLYKRTLKMRGAMPSASSVLFLIGLVANQVTDSTYAKSIPIFKQWDILRA